VASDAASREAYDNAIAAALTAQERLRAARQALSLAVEGPRAEDVETAKAERHAAEGALSLAQHRLRDTRLYAPEAGTVLTRILEPGASVLPNTPAYTLALDDPVWVRAVVSEPDLGHVFPYMSAEITTDSFPGRAYRFRKPIRDRISISQLAIQELGPRGSRGAAYSSSALLDRR
jgi:HlyD family secretion protein